MYPRLNEHRAARRACLMLLFSLAVLTMLGCIRIDLSIVVNEDGSGLLGYNVAVNDTLLTFGADDSFGLQDELPILGEDLPLGAEVSEYRENGYSGYSISVPFADHTELRNILEAQAEMEAEGLIEGPDITQDEDGTWHFSIYVPPLDDEESEDVELATALLADGWFRVRVTLPGDIEEHNADRLEGSELVWELDFFATEPRLLTASTAPGGGLPLASIGVPAAVIAIIILAAVAALALGKPKPARGDER